KVQHIPYGQFNSGAGPVPGSPVSELDHGLFIASLLHTITPAANIRLVRILNDYGVGSLDELLVALQTLTASRAQLHIDPTSRVILNLSLMAGPPFECEYDWWHSWGDIQSKENTYLKGEGESSGALAVKGFTPDDARTWAPYPLTCNGTATTPDA